MSGVTDAPAPRESDAGPSDEERAARLALNLLAEPGDHRLTALVAELGAVELHRLLVGERDPQGLRTDVAARLEAVDPDRELEIAARQGLRFVVPGDREWPTQLDDLAAAPALHDRGGVPVGLWVRGPLTLNQVAGSVAVVGARAATTYGTAVAAEVATTVAQAGLAVVSGGAFGIDVAAHRGALAGDGPTVVVLACGADRAYPAAHRQLIEHVASTGAVVSEAAPGAAPQRIRFLARNRVIAALSHGTVVVEAAVRSGALNTASWAVRLNRTLMGVPGPVTSAASSGVHQQLRTGSMALVTGGADVLELVAPAGAHLVEPVRGPSRPRDRLSRRDQQVLDAVPVAEAASSDSIARVAGIGVLEVTAALTRLELGGFTERGPAGGWRLREADPPWCDAPP